MKSRLLIAAALLFFCEATAYSAEQGAPKKPTGDPCFHHRACLSHVETATILVGAGLLVDALAEYRAAYAIKPTPWLLFHIGQVLHKLDRPSEAVPYFQRYLETVRLNDPEQIKLARQFLVQAQQAAETAARAPSRAIALMPRVLTKAPEQPTEPPIYKRGWFWSAIGIATVIVAVGVTEAAVAATHQSPSPVPTGWPTFRPFN